MTLTSAVMSSGLLARRATLDGCTEGITCIDFSPTVRESSSRLCSGGRSSPLTSAQGHGLLAASYDKSALLWQRGSAAPKVTPPSPSPSPPATDRETVCQLTLTGHSRKVTAARFCTLPHQAATGSADRSIRLWDLHRAACQSPVEGQGQGRGRGSAPLNSAPVQVCSLSR